ncbi:MAG: hypothetical protein QOF74_1225, partial [Caballeronia mineralivorans]|nr:hypothetical protein [Caballeronia mineralivorans]
HEGEGAAQRNQDNGVHVKVSVSDEALRRRPWPYGDRRGVQNRSLWLGVRHCRTSTRELSFI